MKYGKTMNLVGQSAETYRKLLKTGYDYVEGSFSALTRASEQEWQEILKNTAEAGIKVPVCNGMFPADIRLTCDGVDPDQVREFVELGFSRASQLGMKKVVLGSNHSRNLTEGYPLEKAYDEFAELIRTAMLPAAVRYDISILIEPLRYPACNFIHTLADGMKIVDKIQDRHIGVIADTIHMMSSGEDPEDFVRFQSHIYHVHISEWERALPEFGFSTELLNILRVIKNSGYDLAASYECSSGNTPESPFRALWLLKLLMGR